MKHTDYSTSSPAKLAIMASGSGSNAENFIHFFRDHPRIMVALIISGKPGAYVLERAKKAGIPGVVLNPGAAGDRGEVERIFDQYRIDAVVLAGYMKLIPPWLIKRYPGKIFNIHPALLPKFGGKGMYGMHVHRAVIAAGEKKSGISIHLVNEAYDEGRVLFQASLDVLPQDTPESLAEKVKKLEHAHYPEVVENHLLNLPEAP